MAVEVRFERRTGEPAFCVDLVQFPIYGRTMIKLNIHQAKANLSRYLGRLAKGEAIVLGKQNTPIAEIRPLPPERQEPRPIGLVKGKVTVLAGFNDPLPGDVVAAFEGKGT